MDFINTKNSNIFTKRCSLGDYGEELAKELFKVRGIKYKDVSKIHKYQLIDVDFIIYTNDIGEYLETKTFKDLISKDKLMIKYKTEYLDEEMKKKKGNDAWLNKTEAKYIMFCCKATNKIILITLKALKDYIEEYKDTKYITSTKFFDEDLENGGLYDRYNYVYYINIPHLIGKVNVDKIRLKTYTDLM